MKNNTAIYNQSLRWDSKGKFEGQIKHASVCVFGVYIQTQVLIDLFSVEVDYQDP